MNEIDHLFVHSAADANVQCRVPVDRPFLCSTGRSARMVVVRLFVVDSTECVGGRGSGYPDVLLGSRKVTPSHQCL